MCIFFFLSSAMDKPLSDDLHDAGPKDLTLGIKVQVGLILSNCFLLITEKGTISSSLFPIKSFFILSLMKIEL